MKSDSLKRHEGYLLIDNRVSQGVPDEIVTAQGLPVGAGHGVFEAATYTCSHCHAVVVIEPKRTRARAYCGNCNRYICDGCEFIRQRTLVCRSMDRVIDELLEGMKE